MQVDILHEVGVGGDGLLTRGIGNHDITLDKDFYTEHGLHFHNQYPQDSQACRDLFEEHPSITYLNHESTTVYLKSESGPRTTFNVFGSPFSPANGLWAFSYPPESASKLWAQIPLDTDIVLTHTPPKFHCDEAKGRGAAGCEALRHTLWRVRPRLAVCGHVHEGRGAERILWDLESPHVQYKELDTRYWVDPGRDNKKQSLLDLSASGGLPLDNSDDLEQENLLGASLCPDDPDEPEQKWCRPWRSRFGLATSSREPISDSRIPAATTSHEVSPLIPDRHLTQGDMTRPSSSTSDPHVAWNATHSSPDAANATDGTVVSAGLDLSAVTGRKGKRETCVVNAAIVAAGWRRGTGQVKKYNKAIVVDLDLPVW